MKKNLILIVMLCMTMGFPALGIAANAPSTSSGQDVQRKERSEKSLEERFRTLGRELDELKAKIGPAAEEARRETEQYKGKAQKKQKEAAARLEELRTAMKKKWKEISDEMNAAIADFEKEFEQGGPRPSPGGSSDRKI